MAALTGPRNTPNMERMATTRLSLQIATATQIWEGGLVALNASGFLIEGATAATLIAAGVASKSVNNAGANGALSVDVVLGIFKFANSGGDAVVQADIGKTVFIVDDQTVSHSNGGNTQSAAGKAVQLDSDGVWVLVSLI